MTGPVRQLEHILLDESFVLGIRAQPGTLEFDVDFALLPDHESYQAPRADELYCYLRGRVVLVGVRSLTWRRQGLKPAVDASGEADFGTIDRFEADNTMRTWNIDGDWGAIRAEADGIKVFYSNPG